MTRCLLYLASFLLYSGLWAAPARIQMQVGELRELKVAKEFQLRLNQKHIVELEAQGEGRFQILALRPGLVFIRAFHPEREKAEQSWVLEVLSRSQSGGAELLQQPQLKAWLCQEPGVSCDEAASIVRGQTASLAWLHEARERCQKQPPCRFQVRLRASAQELWAGRIAEDLSLKSVAIDPEGFVVITSPCLVRDAKQEEEWQRWTKERYGAPLHVRCERLSDGRFRLDVLAVAQRKNSAELSNPLSLDHVRLLPEQGIEAFIKGLSKRSDTKVLAHPQVLLNLGATLELSDGMDIASLAPQKEQNLEIWKAVGFQLQIRLLDQRESQVKTAISMQLSRPREGQRALDRSSLQTEAWLKQDELQMIGRIQARTQAFEASRLAWFGSLPIIGQLFRWELDSNADSEVFLLLRIEEHKALIFEQEEIDRLTPSAQLPK